MISNYIPDRHFCSSWSRDINGFLFSYDGAEFALNVEKGVSDRLKKGKPQKGFQFLVADFRFCKCNSLREDVCSDNENISNLISREDIMFS